MDNKIVVDQKKLLDLIAGRELLNELTELGFSSKEEQQKILNTMEEKNLEKPEDAIRSLGLPLPEDLENVDHDKQWVAEQLASEFGDDTPVEKNRRGFETPSDIGMQEESVSENYHRDPLVEHTPYWKERDKGREDTLQSLVDQGMEDEIQGGK
jgi:hypothetical protein